MNNIKAYPPSMPLDIEQFNTVTGGKSTYQQELLELFFLNSSECTAVMERNINSGSNKIWHDALEELKNISSKIGAIELSKVCFFAEKIEEISEEEKKKILASIKIHIQRLRAFVRNTGY